MRGVKFKNLYFRAKFYNTCHMPIRLAGTYHLIAALQYDFIFDIVNRHCSNSTNFYARCYLCRHLTTVTTMSESKNTLYEGECFNICLDEKIPAIYEEWLGRVNGEEFREVLHKKLELYKAHHKKYPTLGWLSDIRELRGPGVEDQTWASHEFHQMLYPAGVRKVAFVVAAKTYMRLSNEQVAGLVDDTGVNLCYFDSFEDAAEWLGND